MSVFVTQLKPEKGKTVTRSLSGSRHGSRTRPTSTIESLSIASLHAKTPAQGKRMMSTKEVHSTCHRLSRPNKKYEKKIPIASDIDEPYADTYFREHPPDENFDFLPPADKLQMVDNIEDMQERLVKKKVLRILQNGEFSEEVLDSTIELGDFYQDEEKADSSLRHYNKADSIISVIEESGGAVRDQFHHRINLGISEAYFMKRKQNEANVQKSLNYYGKLRGEDLQSEQLFFRKLLLDGRHKCHANNLRKGMHQFKKALDKVKRFVRSRDKQLKIYREMAQVQVKLERFKEAEEILQKSVDAFNTAHEYDKAEQVQKEIAEIEKLRIKAEYSEVYEEDEEEEEENEANLLLHKHHHHHVLKKKPSHISQEDSMDMQSMDDIFSSRRDKVNSKLDAFFQKEGDDEIAFAPIATQYHDEN